LAAVERPLRIVLVRDGGSVGRLGAFAALDESLLREPAEAALARELGRIHVMVQPKLQHRDYTGVLTDLAGLRDSVDSFFDQVLVMCEDQSLRCNRLTLLHKLNGLFLEVADISRLQG
jgi:glycyl-tRNA synthetase beta chain